MPPQRPRHCYDCPDIKFTERLNTPDGFRVAGCSGPLAVRSQAIAGGEVAPGIFLAVVIEGGQETVCGKDMPQQPQFQPPHAV